MYSRNHTLALLLSGAVSICATLALGRHKAPSGDPPAMKTIYLSMTDVGGQPFNDEIYRQACDELKRWGRYRVTKRLEDADLALQITETVDADYSSGQLGLESSVPLSVYTMTVIDRKPFEPRPSSGRAHGSTWAASMATSPWPGSKDRIVRVLIAEYCRGVGSETPRAGRVEVGQ